MAQHLIELIQRPTILHDRIHPPPEPKRQSAKAARNVSQLMKRVLTRQWLSEAQDQLMSLVKSLRQDVEFIEHLKTCRMCLMLIDLDVTRYNGNHSFWWCSIDNNPYLEERYPSCPKEENYHIGNYWEQYAHYQKYGNTDVPGENTQQFILDRAKWAYKIYGKQIRIARRLLRLVRAWNFTEEIQTEYIRLYDRLGIYEISLPYE